MKIRKAVIPAAGLGTRFLPATKAQPKEMLPIVDKPTIQYIVEEAISAGIESIERGRSGASIWLPRVDAWSNGVMDGMPWRIGSKVSSEKSPEKITMSLLPDEVAARLPSNA